LRLYTVPRFSQMEQVRLRASANRGNAPRTLGGPQQWGSRAGYGTYCRETQAEQAQEIKIRWYVVGSGGPIGFVGTLRLVYDQWGMPVSAVSVTRPWSARGLLVTFWANTTSERQTWVDTHQR
jgi:hypothetical protein